MHTVLLCTTTYADKLLSKSPMSHKSNSKKKVTKHAGDWDHQEAIGLCPHARAACHKGPYRQLSYGRGETTGTYLRRGCIHWLACSRGKFHATTDVIVWVVNQHCSPHGLIAWLHLRPPCSICRILSLSSCSVQMAHLKSYTK